MKMGLDLREKSLKKNKKNEQQTLKRVNWPIIWLIKRNIQLVGENELTSFRFQT